MSEQDQSGQLVERVLGANADRTALRLVGSDSKSFYGRSVEGERLELAAHSGIVNYQPSELVVTARCGTSLQELNAVLAEAGQMLPFDPPQFDGRGTVGGAVASGLSGPGRPWRGAARDLILGCRVINGRGEHLRFGGEVMKNVAGYDVSRLMTGALGTLGIVTEASFKVLPRPETETTLRFELEPNQALERLGQWRMRPYPISAACWHQGVLRVRLSGSAAGVDSARSALGGETLDEDFWAQLRDHTLAYFDRPGASLWRISLPPAAPMLEAFEDTLIDWGGAQRWCYGNEVADTVVQVAAAAGGHATLFRGDGDAAEVFHPPDPTKLALHRRIKSAFDPNGLFNPGRMYADF